MATFSNPIPAAWGASSLPSNRTVVDNTPADMLYMIDPHWYQYPPMNPLWYSLLAFVLVISTILALSGNFVVIYVFLTTKNLRTPSNLYILNLAFSDFMIMLTMAPMMIINCMYESWIFGPLMCEVYGAMGSIFGCGSIWSMILIGGDRYNVIVKGMAGRPLTMKMAAFKVFLLWVWVVGWTMPPFFGWNRYVPEGNLTACGTDYLTQTWLNRSYLLAYGFVCYLFPFLLLVYSYFFIVKAVCDHEKQMREQAKKMNVASLRSADQKNMSAEARLAKVALTTCSLWFLAWTPYAFINFVGVFDLIKLTPVMTIWSSVFAKCNAIYNPIVYGISHPKYREALYVKFPCLNCATSSTDDTQSANSGKTTCDNASTE